MKLILCLMTLSLIGVMGQQYFGVNEPALGFSADKLPGQLWFDFPLIPNESIDYFAAKGMNTIRVGLIWERAQPTLFGALDSTYIQYLTDSVNYVTNTKGMYCLLDLHNYHRYRNQVIGSTAVPYTALTDVWQRLATLYKDNPRMIWGTMNEPYGITYLAARLGANAAIKGIRDAGATQLITISGNDYSSVSGWVGTNSVWMGPSNITDPLNNWMYEMHQYFDNQGGSTVCVPTWDVEGNFAATTTWARNNGVKIFLGEFGLNDSDQCIALLNRIMTFLKANKDVWNGWTWWSAGPWWPEDYVNLIEPKADGSDRNRIMGILQGYFPTAATPSPTSTRTPTPSTSRSPSRSPTPSTTRSPSRTPTPSASRSPTPSTSRVPSSATPSVSRAASPSASRAPVVTGRPQYFGVNEAALGLTPDVLPGQAWVNYPLISESSLDYFAAKRMNTIRVPITWERLQPTLNGALDTTYLGYLTSSVNYITNTKGMYCVIDIHNYHRYRGQLLGSAAVPYNTITNLWYRLAGLFKTNPRVIFGTMNQPYGVSYLDALLGANAAIAGVRGAGATQPVTISGSDYSAVSSWVGTNSLWLGPGNITDPLNNFMYEMHQFFDGQGGTTVCQPDINVDALFGGVTQWARSLGVKVFLGSFGINDSDQCLPLLNRLMTYINANKDVWNGWTWWAAGPWWGANNLFL